MSDSSDKPCRDPDTVAAVVVVVVVVVGRAISPALLPSAWALKLREKSKTSRCHSLPEDGRRPYLREDRRVVRSNVRVRLGGGVDAGVSCNPTPV